MLRIDRNDLPQIPRPVYEFVLERPAARLIRVSVQVGGDREGRWTEFPLEQQTAAAIERWLLDLDYPFESIDAWRDTAREIARIAVEWTRAQTECG